MVRAIAWALALCIAGCDCDEGLTELFYVAIRSDCDAPPCGWEAQAGEVAVVALYHRGLPGLRLGGEAAVTRAVGPFEIAAGPGDGVSVRALLSCDPDTRVGVVLDTVQVFGGEDEPPTTLEATLSDPEAGVPFGRIEAALTSSDYPAGDHPALSGRRLYLVVEGPGGCTIGDIRFLNQSRRMCQ